MSTTAVVAMQTWQQIKTDFEINWLIYVSMPIVAAFVGWGTKIVALEMLYRPVEFKGVGPIGWQGIIPRRAGKVGAKTIELLTENLLKPEDIIDRIDANEAVDALRVPLTETIQDIARDLAEQIRPGMWDSLPAAGRKAVLSRIEGQAPRLVEKMLNEMKADLNRYVDVQFLAVMTLVRNKDKLNKLMRGMTVKSMAFMRRSGIYFGLMIGCVQMVVWGLFKEPLIMPLFGFGVGSVSDYVALNMLFRPVYPTKYLGFIRFQGVLHAEREQITRDYAKMIAEDLFSPEILFDGVLKGPGADKLFALVGTEIETAFDAQTGFATPLVKMAVGSGRYNALKDNMVQMVLERVPTTMRAAQDYAMTALGLEQLIAEKMRLLTNEQYESILRPVFKDDEKIVIAVGAILGGVVGEIQVLIMEHFGRHADTHSALPDVLSTLLHR